MANYSGLFGSLIGGAFDLIGSAAQFGYDKDLMDKQNQFNLNMWNKQNEYNSPEQQMQRFQKAGLSSQLMYGQGSAGNAPSAPVQSVPSMDLANPISKMGNVFDAIQAFQQIKMNEERIEQEQLKTFMSSMSVQDFMSQLNARWSLGSTEGEGFAEQYRGKIYSGYEPLKAYYRKLYAPKLDILNGQGREWQYRGKLVDQDINIRDPWWTRLIANVFGESISRLRQLVKDGERWLYK